MLDYMSEINISTKSNKTSYWILSILAACVYTLEYNYSYYNFVVDAYEYTNISHVDPLRVNYSLLLLFTVLPILFFKGIRNVASGFSFMCYMFVYIPFINTLMVTTLPLRITLPYIVVSIVVMCLFFKTDNKYYFSKVFKNEKYRQLCKYSSLQKAVVIVFLIILFLFRNQMTFYNILSESDELYEFRADFDMQQHVSVSGVYLLMWIENILLPILLVTSYIDKRKIAIYSCILGFVLIFMITKTKVTLVMPFVMLGVLKLYSVYRELVLKYIHLIIMIALGVVSYILCILYKTSVLFLPICTLVNYRIQCVEGAQLERYLRFFEVSNNPYTYYSHIKFINMLTNAYPYTESIGKAVAGNGSNSNATFLLMDGTAAMGIWGFLYAAIFFIIMKSILNSISYKYNYFFLFVILLYSFNSVINTSLFTSLLSFGLIPFYFIMKYINIKQLR